MILCGHRIWSGEVNIPPSFAPRHNNSQLFSKDKFLSCWRFVLTRLDRDTGFCCSLLGVSKAGSDILGVGPEFLLDTQELVVFCHPFAPAWRACLDLTSAEADDEVGDEAILSLARPVRYHGAPTVCFC